MNYWDSLSGMVNKKTVEAIRIQNLDHASLTQQIVFVSLLVRNLRDIFQSATAQTRELFTYEGAVADAMTEFITTFSLCAICAGVNDAFESAGIMVRVMPEMLK